MWTQGLKYTKTGLSPGCGLTLISTKYIIAIFHDTIDTRPKRAFPQIKVDSPPGFTLISRKDIITSHKRLTISPTWPLEIQLKSMVILFYRKYGVKFIYFCHFGYHYKKWLDKCALLEMLQQGCKKQSRSWSEGKLSRKIQLLSHHISRPWSLFFFLWQSIYLTHAPHIMKVPLVLVRSQW